MTASSSSFNTRSERTEVVYGTENTTNVILNFLYNAEAKMDICADSIWPSVAMVLTSMLKIVLEDNGFEVDAFEDAIVALKYYKASLYDLLILDIKMPEMDGFELYDEIKKIDDKMKVCFLTASEMYYNNLRKDKYSSLDKDLFIQKPIENEELVNIVNKILNS
jgi:CheY-like chemotaxis protein